jgi:hypothetical protein
MWVCCMVADRGVNARHTRKLLSAYIELTTTSCADLLETCACLLLINIAHAYMAGSMYLNGPHVPLTDLSSAGAMFFMPALSSLHSCSSPATPRILVVLQRGRVHQRSIFGSSRRCCDGRRSLARIVQLQRPPFDHFECEFNASAHDICVDKADQQRPARIGIRRGAAQPFSVRPVRKCTDCFTVI